MLDQRLQQKIIKIVDVSYGGENGFNQAIELCAETLANVKFIQEKKLISRYFEEIAQDSGKYCYGVADTLYALDMGAVETLIVWENLEVNRYVLKNNTTGEEKTIHLNKEQEADKSHFVENGVDLEVVDKISLLEWFANNYKKFGAGKIGFPEFMSMMARRMKQVMEIMESFIHLQMDRPIQKMNFWKLSKCLILTMRDSLMKKNSLLH